MNNISEQRPSIGLALGSGSARGWAHIGVIRALAEMGIEPDIVAGSSIGALVGAAYASDQLDKLERWVISLTWKEILNYLDVSLLSGGIIQGDKLLKFVRDQLNDPLIESLPHPFGAVATDLDKGREVWLRDGHLMDAVRASIGLPGLFTPIKLNGRWLVDGGLANPVPVSLCRAMGADVVIAVNLNSDIIGKHSYRWTGQSDVREEKEGADKAFLERISAQLKNSLYERKAIPLSQLFGMSHEKPGLFEVVASAINIMQDRLTRSRMAGDPPEVVLSPLLSQLGLMEFDKASAAIKEGRACVERMKPALEQALGGL
ncbi:MAG: patatin-like phospholipase RssA [Gammaproteobacteria bacterium]|nr:patatin-like phospholipase RssA [Gammaproteobacteria bacterium]